MPMQRRIKRNYRRSAPSKFLSFCQTVKHCLKDNPHFPDSIWGGNATVRERFFEAVTKLEVAYHLASNGDRILIRDRDKLMEEMVAMLDQIASLLEAASVSNPDALFTTGFSVTQERRSSNRVKLALTSPSDFAVTNSGESGKAVASASTMPGAFNQEIQINRKDPSMEADWFHKSSQIPPA